MQRLFNRANILGILVSGLGLLAFAAVNPEFLHATQGPLFALGGLPFLEDGAKLGQGKDFGWAAKTPPTAESRAMDELIRTRALGSWSGDEISELSQFILAKSEQYGVSPFLVLSLIDVESQFRPEAVSRRGAVGLMQLLPGTAEEVATNLGLIWHRELLTDPKANIELGLRYMALLKKQFGSEEDALTAYNMGPGALRAKRELGEDISRSYFRLVQERMQNFRHRAQVSRARSRLWARAWL
jgi:soluble lytic murein transglycosylase-like protein